MDAGYEYVAYIDEAGETGLRNIVGPNNSGASEWLILAATVISKSNEANIPSWRNEIVARCASRQARGFHFRKAKLNQQIEAANRASSYHMRHFLVCSHKRNMKNYKNPFAASRNPDLAGLSQSKSNWFYYWLVRLLLERVTDFVYRRSMMAFGEPKHLRVEFSKRGGMRYDELIGYLIHLNDQSRSKQLFLQQGDIRWNVLDPENVHVFDHHSRAGLIFPDIVASAFYQACDKHERGKNVEPRPALALKPRIARKKLSSGAWSHADYGLKLMPNPKKLILDADQRQIFEAYGYRFR